MFFKLATLISTHRRRTSLYGPSHPLPCSVTMVYHSVIIISAAKKVILYDVAESFIGWFGKTLRSSKNKVSIKIILFLELFKKVKKIMISLYDII